jgi:hypothetical protein
MLLARYATTEGLEILDERGKSVGSVTLPMDPRLFGPEKGTVFLNRTPPVHSLSEGPPRAA